MGLHDAAADPVAELDVGKSRGAETTTKSQGGSEGAQV
jgi:hypothetical protein